MLYSCTPPICQQWASKGKSNITGNLFIDCLWYCVTSQAMLDVVADAGLLATSLQVISLMQMVLQARWNYDNSLLTLPHLQPFHLARLRRP